MHLGLAAAIVAAVFVQVYLIGAYIFDGGQGALDAHRSIGLTTHGMVSAAALVAWLPRADVVLSLVLLAVGTVQIALVDGHRWVGGLHPLGALFVLGDRPGPPRPSGESGVAEDSTAR